MKYIVDFQYLAAGETHPVDIVEAKQLELASAYDPSYIPNVGDYVAFGNSLLDYQREHYYGKVRSRLFTYYGSPEDPVCEVTIVLQQADGDWSVLRKK